MANASLKEEVGKLAASEARSRTIATAPSRSAIVLASFFGLLGMMALPVLPFSVPPASGMVNHRARLTMLRMPASDPLNAF